MLVQRQPSFAGMRPHLSPSRITRQILRAKSHFEVLQLPVEQTTCATVRAAYLSLVKDVHPDQCPHPDAARAFNKLSESYEALRAPGRRTTHLEFERRRLREESSGIVRTLEALSSTRILAAAVGLFLTAELVRINLPDCAQDKEADRTQSESTPIEARRKSLMWPVAPVFSASPGAPLVGHTHQELHDLLRARGSRRHSVQLVSTDASSTSSDMSRARRVRYESPSSSSSEKRDR